MFAGTRRRPRASRGLEQRARESIQSHGCVIVPPLEKRRRPGRVSCIRLDTSRAIERSLTEWTEQIDGATRSFARVPWHASKIEKLHQRNRQIDLAIFSARAIAKRIVVILSFAAASIPLWPANPRQSLLRTGFTSARLSGFIAARLFFSIADARVRTVRLISFATRYGEGTSAERIAFPATEKLHLRVN